MKSFLLAAFVATCAVATVFAADEMQVYRKQHEHLVNQVDSLIQLTHNALSIYQGHPEESAVRQALSQIESLAQEIRDQSHNSLEQIDQLNRYERMVIDLLSRQIRGTNRPHHEPSRP